MFFLSMNTPSDNPKFILYEVFKFLIYLISVPLG